MRTVRLTLALASTFVLATSAPVLAAGVTLVSHGDPYASCSIAGQPGRNYPAAEVEPQAAVNPANSNNIIGAWQQDRWSNGGSRGLVAGFSKDGGKTWKETPLPFSSCAPDGLPFQRASDPWVSIGPDGTAYTDAISFDGTDNRNAVAAATSTDGGKTWRNLHTLVDFETNGGQFFNDKNSITADPTQPGTAYAVWDTLVAPTDHPDDNPHAAAFTGDAFFSKTTDGGQSWRVPKAIIETSQNTQTIGNVIVVDPHINVATGFPTLYDFTDLILQPSPKFNVAFVKSIDGGQNWTAPRIVSQLNAVLVTDPNTGQPIRTGDILPEPSIDSNTGQLYVVWQDTRFNTVNNPNRFDEVVISTSTDGGVTWSAPARVSTPTGRAAFTPTVKVSSDGTVGVSYYDFRELTSTNTTTLPTDYWLKTIRPTNSGALLGCSTSSELTLCGHEQRVSGPFNMLSAPFARGFFVGDYEALATVGTSFQPFFVQSNCTSFDPSTGSFNSNDPACAPASNTATATSNTNPTDVFTATFAP